MANDSCPASVIVVEDNERLRESIGSLLEAHGYPTALAESGEEALALLPTVQRPCLLLIDLLTLRFDCGRLFSELSPDDRVATLPMVLVSVSCPTLFSRPGIVKKPVEFDILLRIVHEHCCGEPRGGGKPVDGRDTVHGTG